MIDLALHHTYSPVAVGDISKREGISTHYLEQILNTLRRRQLVKSLRGPKGGYMLARDPQKITVGEIVEVLEGGISLVDCTSGRKKKKCGRIATCVTKGIWDKLAGTMKDTLHSITLASLAQQQKQCEADKGPKHGYTFHI
jgi:Rrf2 family protein